MSLGECKLTCQRERGATLLPIPRDFDLGDFVVPISPTDIEFTNSDQLLEASSTGVSQNQTWAWSLRCKFDFEVISRVHASTNGGIV